MASADKHAISSASAFGGIPEDYIKIHQKMDCSKSYVPDNRHRALTHTMFWINEVMVPLFGDALGCMTNSDGRSVPVKDVCERHVLEDFRHKFIPTPQDFLERCEPAPWMNNGKIGVPPSSERLYRKKVKQLENID